MSSGPCRSAHAQERTIDPQPDPGTSEPAEPAEPTAAVSALLAANEAFYEAFEAADLDAMSEVWEHSDRVTCVHPGWPARRGWGPVAASWMALFQGPERLQFILTEVRAEVVGDVGWVTLDENLLSGPTGGTVAAVNVFVRTDGRWRMVAHHGAPLAR